MIVILRSAGLKECVKPLLDDPKAPRFKLLFYHEVLNKSKIEPRTYIFADLDRLSTAELINAARLYRRLRENGCRVLNDPARVRKRAELLRVLYDAGINPFNAYPADGEVRPKQFPVFIRVADDHKGTLTDLIPDQASLDSAIEAAVVSGIPRSAILVTEYAAEPIRPKVFRKSSLYRVGDSFIPDIWWYGHSWHIKGDQDNLADVDHYREELEAIREHNYPKVLEDAFKIANIDFGRLDFAIVGGRACVYEINTYPTFFGPRSHEVPEREESIALRWNQLLAAFHAVNTKPSQPWRPLDVAGVSITALNAARAISPALRSYHHDLSREYARRGDLAMAIEEARAEITARPNSPRAWSHLAYLLAKQDKIEDAIAASSRAVELNPRNSREWCHLSEMLIRVGRYCEARDKLVEALNRCGDNWHIHLLLSKVSKDLGNGIAAQKHAELAAKFEARDGQEPKDFQS